MGGGVEDFIRQVAHSGRCCECEISWTDVQVPSSSRTACSWCCAACRSSSWRCPSASSPPSPRWPSGKSAPSSRVSRLNSSPVGHLTRSKSNFPHGMTKVFCILYQLYSSLDLNSLGWFFGKCSATYQQANYVLELWTSISLEWTICTYVVSMSKSKCDHAWGN